MKRTLAILLLIGIAAFCLAGCGMSESERIAQIQGKWIMVVPVEEDARLDKLENLDLYPDEIALCRSLPLYYVYVTEFTMDKTYRMYIDDVRTRAYAEDYLLQVLDRLYQNRSSLTETYGDDLNAMSETEFFNFYAQLYGNNSYLDWIASAAEVSYDFSTLSDTLEHGTFRMEDNKIYFKIAGDTKEEYTTYKIGSDGTLSLQFNDELQVFSRPD